MLLVDIYPDADAISDKQSTHFEVDYISLVNHDTYGPPPLIAPTPSAKVPNPKRARPGERVLYINTNIIAAAIVERVETES